MRGLKLIVLFFSQTFAEVGFTDLASVEYTSADGIVVPLPMTGKDSLFEGVLLNQTGTLHNLRFFSPYITRTFEETTKWYKAVPTLDSPGLTSGRSTDPVILEKEKLAYVLCRLFPSQTGSISIAANNHRNLTYILKTLLIVQDKNDHKDLKMLAGILFCLMYKGSIERGVISGGKRVLKFEISTNTHSVEYTAELTDRGSARVWEDRINMLTTLINITNDPADKIFDTRTIFKAFLAIYLEGKDSLTYFYKEYFTLFKKLGIELPEQATKVNEDKIKKLLTSVETEASRFPYRPNSTPPYRSMPVYLGNDQFVDKETFSTCSESALYHLCNCVLWDLAENKYINVLDTIFNGKMKGIPDYNEMREWHKLIENLSEGVCSKEQGPTTYDSLVETSKKVFYAKDYSYVQDGRAKVAKSEVEPGLYSYTENGETKTANNEVEPGLINFIRLLEILTNNNGKLVPKILPLFAIDGSNNIDAENTSKTLQSDELNTCLKEVFGVVVGGDTIK